MKRRRGLHGKVVLRVALPAADRRIAAVAATDPIVPRLATAPGIGPVTASAFVATIDEITRFRFTEGISTASPPDPAFAPQPRANTIA